MVQGKEEREEERAPLLRQVACHRGGEGHAAEGRR